MAYALAVADLSTVIIDHFSLNIDQYAARAILITLITSITSTSHLAFY